MQLALMVNGKHYPLWSQFIEKQHEWIGGELVEPGNAFADDMKTTITGITLRPNGAESAFFTIDRIL